VAITDFGLSTNQTTQPEYQHLALKWMPPELLDIRRREFTKFSDGKKSILVLQFVLCHKIADESTVWSYGVVLWEILTGEEPFADLDCEQAALDILTGKRLQIPEEAGIFSEILNQCWELLPTDRPTFEQIYVYFNNHCTNITSRE
jgi:serine/threonine protein kinase